MMFRRFIQMLLLSAALSACFLTAGCGSASGDKPVPRRVAYPRLEPYDSVYVSLDRPCRINIEVNAAARQSVERDSAGIMWIDIDYPRYGAVLHLTLNSVSAADELADIADNREERFKRDTEGMRVSVSELDNEFATTRIMRGLGASVTPLHIMASDGRTFFLSGALELKSVPASAEESAPVVDAVYADLLHLGRSLKKL